MASQHGKQTIAIHILSNTSRSKGNQKMKCAQLTEYNNFQPAWLHLGCIFETSHIQCFRDISKRANMQISETSPRKLIKGVS